MINFDVVTLFPEIFTPHFNILPFKKALDQKSAKYKPWNLRDYAINEYGSVDDKPYGGGVGMILMIEPIYKVLKDIYGDLWDIKGFTPADPLKKIILLSPGGQKFTQKKAEEISKCSQITLICGRYEGVDARVGENLATDVISIGNFVTSGGELPALLIMESVTRLLPGVLEKPEVLETESFVNEKIEYPQYTRPEDFFGLKVPEVLLSGNHKKIDEWRQRHQKDLGEKI